MGRQRAAVATIPQFNHQPQRHFPAVGTVVVISHRKIPQLLHQEQRSRRPGLEAQPPLAHIRPQAPDADLLVHCVVDAVQRQLHLLLLANPLELRAEQLLELVDLSRASLSERSCRTCSTPSATICELSRRCRSTSTYRMPAASRPRRTYAELSPTLMATGNSCWTTTAGACTVFG